MGKNEHIVCERVNDCTLKLVSMTSYSHLISDTENIFNFLCWTCNGQQPK